MASPTPSFISSVSQPTKSQGQTRLRLRIAATDRMNVNRVLQELTVCCGITLKTVPVQNLSRSQVSTHAVDLDLQGSLVGIQQALQRLQTFPIKIQGRANPDGDSWYC